MQIIVPCAYQIPDTEQDIASYAERELDACRFWDDPLDIAAKTAENTSKALGRLLDVLARKGLLTAPEITEVVEGHPNPKARFTDA